MVIKGCHSNFEILIRLYEKIFKSMVNVIKVFKIYRRTQCLMQGS